MVRIPAEYQEVEYIESTGTQWIDTEYVPTIKSWAECEYSLSNSYTGEQVMLGASNSDYTAQNTTGFTIELYNYRNWYAARSVVATYGALRSIGIELNVKHTVVLKDTSLIIDGFEVTLGINMPFDCEWPIFLFAINAKGEGAERKTTTTRLHSVKLYEDDSLKRNFIPCYHKTSGEIGMYDTVTGTFYTNQGTGTFLKGNDVTYDPISLLETRRRILLNTPHIESASGSIATFNTDLSANLTDMKIHFHPVQEGTGDPSPDNVRPITGWDGVTVTRCGKNLFDFSAIQWTNGYYLGNITNCDGKAKSAGSYKVSEFVLCSYLANQTITIGFMANAGAQNYVSCCFYTDANEDSYIEDAFITYGRRATGLTVPSNAKYMRFSMLRSASTDSQWFGLKSQIDSYEPYTAVKIPISFPQTIYGGYVDLMKGEVVEENYYTILDGVNHYFTNQEALNNGYASSYEYFGRGRLSDVPAGRADGSSTGYTNLICDTFPTSRTTWRSECVQTDNLANYVRLCLSSNRLQDVSTRAKIVESINAWLTENPINICYKLRTPNTYPLTPQTVKALKGINNIWSDANGDIEVRFWVH